MDYSEQTIQELSTFNHNLYGKCQLLPNSMFNPIISDDIDDYSICYKLVNSMIIRNSSITDAGISVSINELKCLGY